MLFGFFVDYLCLYVVSRLKQLRLLLFVLVVCFVLLHTGPYCVGELLLSVVFAYGKLIKDGRMLRLLPTARPISVPR